MSTPARIDELRKKFDENPRRYFAPLANEYRKAGDLAQAIALCREYLPKQPGHMSGHIVFGQALYEAGGLDEARDVFESALALDPENLIALRHLGDIAKAGGDAAGARRWYERVLDADPRNDDIAAQLATLATGNTPLSSPAVQASVDTFAPSPIPEPDPSMRAVDFDVVNAHVARSTPLYAESIEARSNPPHGGTAGHSDDGRSDAVQRFAGGMQQSAPREFEPLDLDAMESASDDVSDDVTSDVGGPAPGSELDTSPEEGEPVAGEAPHGFSGNDLGDSADAEAGHETIAEAPADTFAHAQRDFEQTETGRGYETANASSSDRAGESVYDSDFAGSEFDDEEFEGGILAPEWPQASELIAKIGTPRSSTPISVRVTPEAVAAFGREPYESIPVESNADVDAQGQPEPVEAAATAADENTTELAATSEDEDTSELAATATDESTTELAPAADESTSPEAPAEDEAPTGGVDSETWAPDEEPVEQTLAGVSAESQPVEAAEDDVQVTATAAEVDLTREETQVSAGEDGDDEFQDKESAEASFADVQVYDDSAAPEAQARPEPSSAFVTETMGELLVSQGFVERAVNVYEELVRRRPYDPVLTSRLAELRERLEHPEGQAAEAAVTEAVAGAPTPQSSPAFALTPPRAFTPQHVTPRSFTPRAFTPQSTASITPPSAAAVHAIESAGETVHAEPVVTARELFARLAARRVPRRTPATAVAAVQGTAVNDAVKDTAADLSSLFGGGAGEGHDDNAARALADAFAPIGAAEMADGASMDFGGGGGSMRTPPSSPAAPSSYTPAQGSMNVPGRAASASPTGSNSFSFDRFFPDPASRATPSTPATPTAPKSDASPAPAPASDDLAEFSAWLKGLGNK